VWLGDPGALEALVKAARRLVLDPAANQLGDPRDRRLPCRTPM